MGTRRATCIRRPIRPARSLRLPVIEAPARSPRPLRQPGCRSRAAAEAEGMTTIGFLYQTYFLLGLLPALSNQQSNQQSAINNQQLKTLIMPGGLGSTHKVLVLGKSVGVPALRGCSFKVRVT